MQFLAKWRHLPNSTMNADVADQFVADANFLLMGCKEQEVVARDAAKLPPEWCNLATATSQETEMLDKTQEYRNDVEQSSSDAVAAAKRVHDLNEEMMAVKINLKKLILTQNFDIQIQELETLLATEREK